MPSPSPSRTAIAGEGSRSQHSAHSIKVRGWAQGERKCSRLQLQGWAQDTILISLPSIIIITDICWTIGDLYTWEFDCLFLQRDMQRKWHRMRTGLGSSCNKKMLMVYYIFSTQLIREECRISQKAPIVHGAFRNFKCRSYILEIWIINRQVQWPRTVREKEQGQSWPVSACSPLQYLLPSLGTSMVLENIFWTKQSQWWPCSR